MIRCCAMLFAWVAAICPSAAEERQGGIGMLLQLDKQPVEPLSFFVRRAPVEVVDSPTEPAKFELLPEGITAHLSEVGHLAGRRTFAIRYLADSRLVHGNVGAVGLVLLCCVQEDPQRFAPLLLAWGEDEGIIDDYSVSPVRESGDFSFIWVRKHYSGTAHDIERIAVCSSNDTKLLRSDSLFEDPGPPAELTKQGWQLWHRGNYFNEETLTWHYHLYRDPAKSTEKDEYPHRYVQVRYKFRDGKLQPEKPEDDESGGTVR